VYQTALRAYETVNRSTMNGREVEAAALAKAASKLKECRSGWDQPDRAARMERALKFNQRVWCILQAELARPENPLPAEIKGNLLRLSAFVDKRSFEILAYPERGKLDMLIEINENIAAGLRSRPAAAEAPRLARHPLRPEAAAAF
jgi:flagellar protein FlaF